MKIPIIYEVVYVHRHENNDTMIWVAGIAKNGKKKDILQVFELPGTKEKCSEIYMLLSEQIKKYGKGNLIN